MVWNWIPLVCGILGLFTGGILGFVVTILAIHARRNNKIEEWEEPETGKPSLTERMNNQDYAFSHQPGKELPAIEMKQKKEDSAYQFLKRNRKE